MAVTDNTSCLCPNCKTDLRKLRYSQVQAHFQVDNFLFPGMADYLKELKSKNQLSKTVLSALKLYKEQSVINIEDLRKSLLRIESVIEITTDKALARTLKIELEHIKNSLLVDSSAPGTV